MENEYGWETGYYSSSAGYHDLDDANHNEPEHDFYHYDHSSKARHHKPTAASTKSSSRQSPSPSPSSTDSDRGPAPARSATSPSTPTTPATAPAPAPFLTSTITLSGTSEGAILASAGARQALREGYADAAGIPRATVQLQKVGTTTLVAVPAARHR